MPIQLPDRRVYRNLPNSDSSQELVGLPRIRSAALPDVLSRMRSAPGGPGLYPAPRQPYRGALPGDKGYLSPAEIYDPSIKASLDAEALGGQFPPLPPLQKVELPGVGRVEKEAIPYLTAQKQLEAQMEEKRRAREEMTAYQQEQARLAQQRIDDANKRAEDASKKGNLRPVQTLDSEGRTVTKFINPQEGQEVPVGETADMRNKKASRALLIPAIDSLEALSQRVITEKMAAIQKARSAGRSVDAALANDPDYRVYQDARMALAGNLAVAQQGSRPSDADIKAIWLPIVPDVFKDTQDSAKMKWEMIRVNSGLPGGAAQPQGGGETTGGGGWVVMTRPDGTEVEVHPDDVDSAKQSGYR